MIRTATVRPGHGARCAAPGVVLCIAALLTACGAGMPEETALSTTQIEAIQDSLRAVVDEVNEAASAKDADAFMALWARTDSVVYVRSGTSFLGWDAVAENHREAFAGPGTWSFTAEETHVRVLGRDSGLATAFIRTGSTGASGESSTGWFTITMGIERRPDGWKVVYAHGSYPPPGTSPWG